MRWMLALKASVFLVGTAVAACLAGEYAIGAPGKQSDQLAAGQKIFAEICSACHGPQGEGEAGPALAPPGSELVTFRNARRLFDYVSELMPDDDPGTLAEQQYYDVIAYLLAWNNLNPGNLPVDATTLDRITFTR